MKKKKDVGLEHIIKLDISAVRSVREIYNKFVNKYGQEKAKEIMNNIYGQEEMITKIGYDKKNEDYDISMIFSGSYDADIVRKACNWIYDHKEEFGDEILEIGCDCGFMTTFLGVLFPEKHITSIDRNQSGIDIAKKNVEKLGIKNVDFICTDACEIKDKKFDTVFSMRTMHENETEKVKEKGYYELVELSDMFEKGLQDYSNCLSNLLKEGGTLVSIERLDYNSLFLAWISAVTKSGLKIDLDSYNMLECMEVGMNSKFQALVFRKADCSEVDSFMSFMNCFATNVDTSQPCYKAWEAKIMCEYSKGTMLDGVEIEDINNDAKSRTLCFIHKDDETCVALYSNNNGNVIIEYHDIAQKEAILDAISAAVQQAKENGFSVKKLELE